MKQLSIILILTCLYSANAYSWGKTGHRIVGEIAQRNLSPQAAQEIKEILGDEDLSKAANWPDEFRSEAKSKYSWPWHYVSIPTGKSYFDQKRSKEGDVIEALFRFEDVLRDVKSTKDQKIEAIRFLVHFLGDLHQPLHVGLEEDRGGNAIKVKWFKTETNLHTVWDEEIINFEQLSYTEYASYLNHFTETEKKEWEKGHYLDWAKESQELRPKVYDIPESKNLSYEYGYKSKPIIEQRLKQAGLRLAYILNNIYAKEKLPPAEFEVRKKIKENI